MEQAVRHINLYNWDQSPTDSECPLSRDEAKMPGDLLLKPQQNTPLSGGGVGSLTGLM